MPSINLLFVITKLELGGAQKQLLSLVENLDKGKFRLFLFTAKNGPLLEAALSVEGLTVHTSRWLERPIHPFKDVLALIELYRFIKKNNIEIVHTHSSKAGILGRLAAKLAKVIPAAKKSPQGGSQFHGVKKIVHTVHGWSFNDYQPILIQRWFVFLERFAGSFTDILIVVSDCDRIKGLNNKIGKFDKYKLIRYGIDFEELRRSHQGLRREFGIGKDALVVGMIACFKPQKAPQDFVETAFRVNKVLPEVFFVLIGDGILRAKIEELIDRYSLRSRVILTGWRQDIPRVLASIDVFVLTSLWEGLPISALEAMASSKPVIATHTGGISEVIEEGKSGFLAAAHDTAAVADKLIMLLKNEKLRDQIGGAAGSALSGAFSLENMAARTQELYL